MKKLRGFLVPVGLAVVLMLCRIDTARAQGNTILVGPTALSFTWQTGSLAPPSQGLLVTSTTEGLAFSATAATVTGSWLAVGAGGTTPFQLVVGVNPTGLAAGVYNGTIFISAAGATNSPLSVPVTLTVTSTSQLVVSPSSLSFYFQTTGSAPAAQTVSVSTSGSPLSFSATATTTIGSWLAVSPGGGITPGSVSVSVNPSGLGAGTYNGTVTISAAGATPGSVSINVTLTVSTLPQLTASPAALTFYFQTGGSQPPQQTLSVSSGATVVAFGVSASTTSGGMWLVAASPVGITPASLNIAVNTAGLAAGTYSGAVTLTGGAAVSNSPLVVAVTLVVSASPLLTVSPASLSFAFQVGGANPASQTVTVASTAASLSYNVSATTTGGAWLAVGPVSGTTSGTITVAVSPAGLSPGTYTGTISIAAAAGNTPQTVAVTLTVSNNPLLSSNPASLSFGFQIGTAQPPSQMVTISSTGAPLGIVAAATTVSGGAWLSVTASGAITPATLTISANPAGLTAGTYTGSITITGAGAANSPLTLSVTLVVSTSALIVTSPVSLTFTAAVGTFTLASQTVALTSTDGSAVAYSVSSSTSSGGGWLLVGPLSGATPTNLNVSVSPLGLAVGVYNGSIVVTAPTAPNSPQTIAVRLVITSGVTIGITPASLTFNQTLGGSAPPPQTLSVSVSGAGGNVAFTATASTTSGGGWLSVSPSSGTTPAALSVFVNATGLTAATYTGSITIVSAGAANSPQVIQVTLTVGVAVALSPTSLSFTYQSGAPLPSAQTLSVGAAGASLSFTATAATTTGGGWLTVSPAFGTTPATLSISVNPIGLSAGSYNGTVAIAATGAINSPQSVTVTLTVTAAPPAPAVNAVVNASTFLPTAVSPGLIITMFGTGIGPATPATLRLTGAGRVDTLLGDTRVLFDGVASPMIYTSSTQVSAIVPYAVFGRFQTTLQIEFQGVRSNGVSLRVVDSAPGIFTINSSGSGPGAILNQNFSVNSAANAAAKGSVVMIYATGEGQTTPAGIDGNVTGGVLSRPMLPVSVTIGGQTAEVLYAGAAPGLVAGVLQVNARVPTTAASGAAFVVVTVGGAGSQTGVTMAVQ